MKAEFAHLFPDGNFPIYYTLIRRARDYYNRGQLTNKRKPTVRSKAYKRELVKK